MPDAAARRLRALIVDDEAAGRAALQRCCRLVPEIEVVGEAEDAAGALDLVRERRPDVVFLDIRLRGSDGFAVVRGLPAGTSPSVVFVTAYDRFAVQAFELRAVDYLLKPFELERFRATVARLLPRSRDPHTRDAAAAATEAAAAAARELSEAGLLRSGRELRVVTDPDARIVLFGSDEVTAVEADANYLHVHARGGRLRTRGTLQRAEETLAPLGFLRIHRSVLVNLRYLREIRPRGRDSEAVLLDGSAWRVSASCRAALLARVSGRSLSLGGADDREP